MINGFPFFIFSKKLVITPAYETFCPIPYTLKYLKPITDRSFNPSASISSSSFV